MSHVDEGTLHAYLDGALDALPAAEAARVREHLATCEVCTARLEEERALRDEAAAILAGAAPDAIEPPPFEELRARARVREGTPGFGRRLARLAWAASVVLAIGAGWMLRAATAPDSARQDSIGDGARTAASPAPAAEAVEGTTPAAMGGVGDATGADADVGERLADASPGTGERPAAAAEGTDRMTAAPVADSGAARPASTTVGVASERHALADLAPVPRVLLESSPVSDEVAGRVVGLDTLTFPRTAAEAKEAVAAAPRREEEAAAKTAVTANRVVTQPTEPAAQELRRSRAEAPPPVVQATQRADLPIAVAGIRSTSLSVPGLQVLSVTGMEGEGLAGAVRVRQLLADGDTLELVHLPSGSDPSALAPVAGDGRTEMVLPRNGGWLVVRAHASRDALLELVRGMEGGG